MMASRLQSADSNIIAAMRSERVRMQAEVAEVIAGAQRTLAQSRELLTEVDALLAREELVPSAPRWSISKAML